MKVILLFDSDKMENAYREYTISADKELRDGACLSIRFCHPSHGELMNAKIEPKENNEQA